VRYTPFETDLDHLEPDDLKVLETVAEGWYIEYKREAISVKAVGKSLSAFANHYGGWLFFGVQEADVDGSKCAGAFPGVALDQLDALLLRIRTGAVHHVSPTPAFDVKVLKGPASSIQLPEGRAVVAVSIPEGGDTPYVHSSGRIYRRKADESDPVHETDRSVLDLLWERRRRGEERIGRLIDTTPTVSKGEWAQSAYLHLHLLTEPLATPADRSGLSLSDFHRLVGLRESSGRMELPLDNVFHCGGDYVGRHVYENDPANMTVTYRYRPDCSCLISIPMRVWKPRRSSSAHDSFVQSRKYGAGFLSLTVQEGHTDPSVVDLSPVLLQVAMLIHKHREVALEDGIAGPFHAKIVLDNVWRVVPFIDTAWYLERIRKFGTPIMQDERLVVPWLLTDFITLDRVETPEGKPADPELLELAGGSLDLIRATLGGLGVPFGLTADEKGTTEITQLLEAGIRSVGVTGEEVGDAPANSN